MATFEISEKKVKQVDVCSEVIFILKVGNVEGALCMFM